MLPFAVDFRLSKQRRVIAVLLAIAVLTVINLSFSGSLKIGLNLAAMGAAYYAWHDDLLITRLVVDAKSQAFITLYETTYEAKLLSGSLITPYVCWFKWQLPEKVLWQCVWQDSLPKDDFRRLRVWARFG